jgi:monoamine oxidase
VTADADVVVIGAGLAGLGAATALRRSGRAAVVLEAGGRIGGRAWTTHPAALGGVWFDMGAIWLHDAEHNPLTPIAQAAGDKLLRSDTLRIERTFVGGRLATDAELADYADAWPRFEAAVERLLQSGTDPPLSAVAQSLPDDPWAATVESWEGPVICTVDGDDYSLLDWKRNVLGGSNLVPDGGIGAFVQRRLGVGLDVRLDTPVTRVRWGGAEGSVTVETNRGALTARSCIVTVSTGVLRAGVIAFDPALPPRVQDALHVLPMGLATKVALRATGPDRLDLPPYCSVDRQVGRDGDLLVPIQCWPYGRDYVQCWIGASRAWGLQREGDAAAVDFMRGELRRLFGGRADALFDGAPSLVTQWGGDPLTLGAYAYASPGHADARARLAEPLADGHLLFAGEACHIGYAGTLAGAWLSGEAAAGAAA